MAKKHRTVEIITAELEALNIERGKVGDKMRDLNRKAEALIDECDNVRIAGFDKSIVQRATDLGINPKNFETQDELMRAIETRQLNEA